MRGQKTAQQDLAYLINVEDRIPATHPIREVKRMTDAGLRGMDKLFAEMYAAKGRPSIPPERLLKAKVLMALFSVRSDRQFCERLRYDLLFQWFLDLNPDELGFDASTFSQNQTRLLQHQVADLFFSEVVELAKARNVEFNNYVIGAYDVAVIVNAASPVGNLTRDQVRDLFTGVAQNWKDVGGPDAPVHLYIRHPISGTYLGFRELAMENKPYALHLQTCTNYEDIVNAVAQDAGGIGYSTFGLASKTGVKPVSIGGVTPSVESVNKGQYPYARVLRLYTDKATEAPIAHSFIEFVQSSHGQKVLDQMGYAPHP